MMTSTCNRTNMTTSAIMVLAMLCLASTTTTHVAAAAVAASRSNSATQQRRELSSGTFSSRFSWSHMLYSLKVCSRPSKICPTPKCNLLHESKKPICKVLALCSSTDDTTSCAPSCCDADTLGDYYGDCVYMQSYVGVENNCEYSAVECEEGDEDCEEQANYVYGNGGNGEDGYNAYVANGDSNGGSAEMGTSGGTTRSTDTMRSEGIFNPTNYLLAAAVLVAVVAAALYRKRSSGGSEELAEGLSSNSHNLEGAVNQRLEMVESGAVSPSSEMTPVTRAESKTHFISTNSTDDADYTLA